FGISFDQQSVSDFFEQQQGLGERYGSGADLQSLPLPLKIFSLMFRPLFFDVSSWLHRGASIENAILLYICSYIVYHIKMLFALARNIFFLNFASIFAVVLIFLLSL